MPATPAPAANPLAADRAPAVKVDGKADSVGCPATEGPGKGAGGSTEVSCGLLRATAMPMGTELSAMEKIITTTLVNKDDNNNNNNQALM